MKAKVLVCHGADDPFVKPADIAALQDEMRKAESGLADDLLRRRRPQLHQKGSRHGQDQGHRLPGSRRPPSWQAMKDFFAEIFADSQRTKFCLATRGVLHRQATPGGRSLAHELRGEGAVHVVHERERAAAIR